MGAFMRSSLKLIFSILVGGFVGLVLAVNCCSSGGDSSFMSDFTNNAHGSDSEFSLSDLAMVIWGLIGCLGGLVVGVVIFMADREERQWARRKKKREK